MRPLGAVFTLFILTLCSTFTFAQQPVTPAVAIMDNHGVDSINLSTLSVNLNLPIRTKTTGGFSYSLQAISDCNPNFLPVGGVHWTCGIQPNSQQTGIMSFGLDGGLIGYTATYVVSSPVLCPGSGSTSKYTNWIVVDPSGGQHALPANDYVDSAGCFVTTFTDIANDNSGLQLQVKNTAPVSIDVTLPNGSTTGWVSLATSIGSLSTQITDAYGNLSSFNSTSGVYTDTLGQQALTASGADFTWTDSSGNPRSVTLTQLSNQTIRTNFGCSGIPDQNTSHVTMTTAVNYRDGTSLGLGYEPTTGFSGDYTGRLASLTLRTGGTVTYTYGAMICTPISGARPTSLSRTDSDGTTTYTVTPPGGGSGQVTTVVDPGGNKTVYTFEGASYSAILVQVQTYQNTGTVSSPVYTLLTTDILCYNGATTNCTTTVPSFPLSEKDVYHTINGMTSSSRVQLVYDQYGNVTNSATYDFGATTPTLQTTSVYGSWNGSACAVISSTITNKPCDVLTKQNGNSIAESRFSYDSLGTLLTTYQWNGSSWLSNGTPNVRNGNGTIATAYDLANAPTSFAYGGSGGCNGLLPTSIAKGGLTTYLTWNCDGGVLTSRSVPNNSTVVTSYGYVSAGGTADPFWRLSSTTDPLGNTSYVSYTATSVNPFFYFASSGEDTTTWIDLYGRANNVQTKQHPGSTQYDTVSKSYGWSSTYKSVVSTMPCLQIYGTQCSFSTGTTTSVFDPLGRLFTSTDGGGGILTKTYAENDVTSTLSPAPAGENTKSVQSQYDGLGRLQYICAIQSSGGSSCGQNTGTSSGISTAYSYTASSGSRTVTATRGTQSRSVTRDALGRVTSRTTPEGGTWQFSYDVQTACSGSTVGHLTRSLDPNGNSICYFYDAVGRPTMISANGTTCRKFYYDNSTGFFGTIPAGITVSNSSGRIVEAATSNCSTTLITDEWFSYDLDGNLTDMWESTLHSGIYYHSSATFFPNGVVNTLKLANPTLYTETYGLEGEGRLGSLTSGTQVIVSSTVFNPAGQPTQINIGTSTDNDTYTYDPATGRMTGWAFNVSTATQAGALTWNANATLREVNITDGFHPGGTQDCKFGTSSVMGYDDVGRLLSDTCGSTWTQTFTYDQYDNTTKSGSIAWAPGYNSNNNHYMLAGTSYDANGDLLTDTFHTYEWNEFAKMKSVDRSGTNCATSGQCVIYDAFGRVVEIATGSTYSQIWYTQLGKTAYMNGGTYAYAYWPTPGGGTLLKTSGAYYYEHKDWLGSARISSSVANETIIDDRAFAPYGEIYNPFGSTAQNENIFTGDTQDIVNGTYDTPNRELNPTQGRWLSPDPAGFGWNQYSYATNPTNSVDLSGEVPQSGPLPFAPTYSSLDGDCSVDGQWASCSMALDQLQSGGGVQCPNNACTIIGPNGPEYFWASVNGPGNYYAYSGPGSLFYSIPAVGLAASYYLAALAQPSFATDPHEYANNLYQDANGVYSYTQAQQGPPCAANESCTWDQDFGDIPAGTDLVGAAHTHPTIIGNGSGDFSGYAGDPGDITTYMSFSVPIFGFVVTPPGDRVLMFDPNLYQRYGYPSGGIIPANTPDPVCVMVGYQGSSHNMCN